MNILGVLDACDMGYVGRSHDGRATVRDRPRFLLTTLDANVREVREEYDVSTLDALAYVCDDFDLDFGHARAALVWLSQ